MSSRRAPLGGSRAPIVITGFGVVSASGLGVDPLMRDIESGNSHVGRLHNTEASDLPNQRGADIRDAPEPGVPRFAHYLELALRGAIEDAEACGGALPVPLARTGIALGTTLGLIDELDPEALADARARLSLDACAQRAAHRLGLGGRTTSFSLACASGLCASEHACAELALDRADAMAVGGADTLGRFMQGGFCSLRGFAPESPDARKATIALGEAAAFAVLEPLDKARARGAHRYGVLESQRLVSDGYHLASPDPSGDGMARAIELAIDDAGLAPSDIGAVVVTAIGSPFHERMLQDVLERALGEHAAAVPIASHELAVGHVLAASGIIVLAYAARLLKKGRVTGSIFGDAHILTLSVGFGGFNGVSILGESA